jgi:hypothetical protein
VPSAAVTAHMVTPTAAVPSLRARDWIRERLRDAAR